MKSAYDEAQILGYELGGLIDQEIYKTTSKISNDNDKFDNGRIFGTIVGLNRAKEIIKAYTSSEMARLINDKQSEERCK